MISFSLASMSRRLCSSDARFSAASSPCAPFITARDDPRGHNARRCAVRALSVFNGARARWRRRPCGAEGTPVGLSPSTWRTPLLDLLSEASASLRLARGYLSLMPTFERATVKGAEMRKQFLRQKCTSVRVPKCVLRFTCQAHGMRIDRPSVSFKRATSIVVCALFSVIGRQCASKKCPFRAMCELCAC